MWQFCWQHCFTGALAQQASLLTPLPAVFPPGFRLSTPTNATLSLRLSVPVTISELVGLFRPTCMKRVMKVMTFGYFVKVGSSEYIVSHDEMIHDGSDRGLSEELRPRHSSAVSCRLPTAAARVRTRVRLCGICGGQSGTGAGFIRVLRFPLLIIIPPTAPHSSSPINWGWYKGPVVDSVSPH
jgi:hypothetical protein